MTSSEFFSPPWPYNSSAVYRVMKSSATRQEWGEKDGMHPTVL